MLQSHSLSVFCVLCVLLSPLKFPLLFLLHQFLLYSCVISLSLSLSLSLSPLPPSLSLSLALTLPLSLSLTLPPFFPPSLVPVILSSCPTTTATTKKP